MPAAPVRAVAAAPATGQEGAGRDLDEAVRLHRAGDPIRAVELYQRILAAEPDHAEAMNYLGVTAGDLGEFDSAIRLMVRSIELRPDAPEFHNNLGNVLKKAGRLDAAENAYRRAVEADAGFAAAWNNLGMVLAGQFRDDEAIRAFRNAIRAQPDFAEAHNNLGNMYYIEKEFAAAEKSYRRAIRARPDYAAAYNNLGVNLNHMDRLTEAEAANRKAIELKPDYPEALNNLGGALHNQGRLAEACDAYRKGAELDPDGGGAYSNLIFSMGLDYNVTAADILAACRAWNQRYGVPRAGRAKPHGNDRDPDRRLRIGYVSADFHDHAVAHFLEPLFSAHDRNAVEVIAYADVDCPDAFTARFEELADRWVSIAGMKDAALVERIRADGIDILIDLSGHTGGNRLTVFAEKPAPVQATWLGYGGSTGLDAMDYRITDAVIDAEGTAEAQHSETLVRLPDCFLCYRPPSDIPEVSPLPAAETGHVTFASFNNLSKVTPQAVALWARVLNAVPGARMIVKGRPFTEPDIRRRYLEIFAQQGVDESRVELLAYFASRRDYLEIYRRVDIVLDTFPYNGGTTTCEALWMGVPVITLAGDRTVARIGASILACIGARDWVADCADAYVEIAGRIAADRPRLKEIRAGLRTRMQDSPLCDGPAFARDMETAYRDMWRRWCAADGAAKTMGGLRSAG